MRLISKDKLKYLEFMEQGYKDKCDDFATMEIWLYDNHPRIYWSWHKNALEALSSGSDE